MRKLEREGFQEVQSDCIVNIENRRRRNDALMMTLTYLSELTVNVYAGHGVEIQGVISLKPLNI